MPAPISHPRNLPAMGRIGGQRTCLEPAFAQLAAIRETGGMVGVNFATSFLRPDGRQDAETPTELVIEHLEHILKHVGQDGVGFGSDFDGARMPTGVGNAAGLQNLIELMRARLRRAADREIVFQKLVTCVGTTWRQPQPFF
jgi:membrane dipeptidase